MYEVYSMIADVIATIICAGMAIVPYMYLFTVEPNELGVFRFVVSLLFGSAGVVGFIAGVMAVTSYFFE